MVTTAPAPINAYSPILFPHTIVAFAPILTPFRTIVLEYSPLLFMALLGLITLVKTIEGPKKTSSSQVTPVYIDTLFWILTFCPKMTSGDITQFCPILQF